MSETIFVNEITNFPFCLPIVLKINLVSHWKVYYFILFYLFLFPNVTQFFPARKDN